jgi:ABC-type transport system involved in multi-copper enzyme maturation permease subunit
MGGIDPEATFAAFLVVVGVAVLGCTLALTLSVWGRKPHEVLLATYFLEIGWLLAYPVCGTLSRVVGGPFAAGAWAEYTNPFRLALRPGNTAPADPFVFLVLCLLLSGALALLATARLRPVAAAESGRPPKSRALPARRRTTRAAADLDRDPVYWRERHRKRPSRASRFVWGAYAVGVAGFTGLVFVLIVTGQPQQELAAFVNGFAVSIGLLLVSVSAVTALADERARGDLDVLLATPLTTRQIVWGKWRAAFRPVPRIALLPGLTAAALSLAHRHSFQNVLWVGGLTLAYGAAVVSFGLAAATWEARLGRALAVSVGVYVTLTVGWPFFAMVVGGRGDLGPGLAIASPFYGPGLLTAMLESGRSQEAYDPWAAIWLVVVLFAAAAFYGWTLADFDRRLGRAGGRPAGTPGRGRRPLSGAPA